MNNYDVIIIGGGLGGLTSGAKLSKEGKRVLLLEQHYIPGGCATTFKRKNHIMEVGLHELDGLGEHDPKKEIFDDLNVFNNIEFIKIPELYHFVNERLDIVIPDNRQKATNILVNKFPKEKKGINTYFKVIYKIQREINKLPTEKWKLILMWPLFPIIYPYLTVSTNTFSYISALLNPLFILLNPQLIFWKHRTIGGFIDSIIDDEDLKLALLANLSYYHDDPYSMSLIYFSAAQASYFDGGGHFIKGGSQKLSDYLVKFIQNNGGDVLLGNKVLEILTQDNKAIGVSYQNSFDDKAMVNKAFADVVIANAAIPAVEHLLPKNSRKELEQKTSKLEKSCSLLSIYIGFNKEIKLLNNKHYSTFVFDKDTKTPQDMLKNNKGDFKKRNFIFVDYSQIDSGLSPKGKSFGAICTVDYSTNWENLSPEDYRKKKEEVAQIFFKRLEKQIPGICKEIDTYEVGTPKTIERYTLNPQGAVYGFSQIPNQAGMFRIPNKSPINNLYFASAWTTPGGGFTGAILSGWFCANEVLRKLPAPSQNKLSTNRLMDDRSVKLIEKNKVASNTLELVFHKPKNFTFNAGQYVIVKIDNPRGYDRDIFLRPLSIVSHPDEAVLKFALRKSNSGFKKSCNLMQPNDTATLYGATGNFCLSNMDKPIVFLVSGIGITPIISILKELEKQNFEKQIIVYYSNKSEESASYLELLENIEIKLFNLVPVFTKTEKRIDINLLTKHIKRLNSYSYYIVGTKGFSSSMESMLLMNHVEKNNITVDDFG